jgi:hypothetical protein
LHALRVDAVSVFRNGSPLSYEPASKEFLVNKKYRIAVRVVIFLVVAYLGLTNYASDVARARIDAAVTKQGGKVNYKKVFYNLFTQHTIISNVSIQPPGVATPTYIDEIVVRRIDLKSPRPTFLSMDMRGMRLDSTILGAVGAARLTDLGYTGPFSLDISIDFDCLLDKREGTIQSLYAVKDVGLLRFSLLFGNIDDSSAINPAFFGYLTMKQAELTYVDASLVERVLKWAAAEKGVEVPVFKKVLATQAEAFVQKFQSPHAADIADALKQFIANPRQLTISINPAAPVPLGEIIRAGSPEAIANLLNLQVKS